MLILVATPIGNLEDLSFRAIESLKNCDYILCEDTRHSSILLKRYDIHKATKSYHQFNESKTEKHIIDDLKNGKTICLISDAGTPAIADPGAELVLKCIENEIEITYIPGPCALIMALVCSGLNTSRFQFLGFLPKKNQALKSTLSEVLTYLGTTIFYESPNRILNFLEILEKIDPERNVAIGRELTKKFETFYRGKVSDLAKEFQGVQVKGELVVLVGENPSFQLNNWENLSEEEHVDLIQSTYNTTRIEAIKTVASLRSISKRDLYSNLLDVN